MPHPTPSRVVATVCPSCGHHLRGHDSVTDPAAVPAEGDVAMCASCLAPSLYALTPLGALVLRTPTVDEELELQTAPQLAAALRARQAHFRSVAAAVAAAPAEVSGHR